MNRSWQRVGLGLGLWAALTRSAFESVFGSASRPGPAFARGALARGAAPATTGLTFATEPGSGSAIVLSTALLGMGSVW